MKLITSVALLVTLAIPGFTQETHDWFERGRFYQIYPRSFKDSDGNGIGDLKGKIIFLKFSNLC